MIKLRHRHFILGLLIISAAFLWVLGSGFLLDLSAESEETYKGLKIFGDIIEEIETNYVDTVDTKDLIQNAIKGMVNSLDPHSQYLPPDEYEDLQSGTKGEFEGVGIVITMPKGILTVISPIDGTPAYRSGIKAKDIIFKIDGATTKGMTISEAVKKIKGPKGTEVVLTIVREGLTKPKDFKLVRDVIPIESVKAITLKPGYGYIWITNFQDNTTKDLGEALTKLESEDSPLKGLVLDLRNNPGGLLDQSILVSNFFLDSGTILSIKGRQEQHTKVYRAEPNVVKRDYPIVVLINDGSASAAEIVAGALQDHKRALLLGTTSFGKGSVQTVKPLRDGSGLKFTIARYYTPSGRSIQAKGIEPDIVVERRIMDGNKSDNNGVDRMKEKDLKNHLEAEPDKDRKDDIDSEKEPDMENDVYGSIKLDRLLSDNQVSRALDILISYDVFKGMDGFVESSLK